MKTIMEEDYESDVRIDYNTSPTERYTRIDKIGHGTYGHVYRSTDHARNDAEVAVKYIEFPNDKSDYERVIREIHCLRHLRHVNLLGLADACGIFRVRDEIGLVTPLYQFTLHKILHHHKLKLMTCQRLSIYEGLLSGLTYMHRNGFYHRDIKPDNVLLNKDCAPVLADYGLAREVNGFDDDQLSYYVVTRWYRAPELIYNVDYDGTVDVWALGCVLAEMISGFALFPGKNDIDQLKSINKVIGSSGSSSETFDQFCQACASSCRARLSKLLRDSTTDELDVLERILVPQRRPSSKELSAKKSAEQGAEQRCEQPVKPLLLKESKRDMEEHLLLELDWR